MGDARSDPPAKNHLRRDARKRRPRRPGLLLGLSLQPLDSHQRRSMARSRSVMRVPDERDQTNYEFGNRRVFFRTQAVD